MSISRIWLKSIDFRTKLSRRGLSLFHFKKPGTTKMLWQAQAEMRSVNVVRLWPPLFIKKSLDKWPWQDRNYLILVYVYHCFFEIFLLCKSYRPFVLFNLNQKNPLTLYESRHFFNFELRFNMDTPKRYYIPKIKLNSRIFKDSSFKVFF